MEDVKINVLLNEEKYEDAIDLMKDKYVELFEDMLNKKNVEIPKNQDFYCYTTRIMSEYPKFINHIDMLRKGMISKDFSYLDEIELLKNTYNYLKVYNENGADITASAGTTNYNSSTRELTYTFNSSWLNSMPYNGQTYKFDFKIFAERFLLMINSPDNNSGIDTCNTFAKGSIKEISGSPRPVSHFDIVLSLTHNFIAN